MPHYIIWILVAILYSPIFYQLYRSRWHNIDYTHAYFILPISLWLAWRNLKGIVPDESANKGKLRGLSLFLLITGLLIFIFGWRQNYLFISTLSLIPVLYGLIIYLYGTQIAKTLSFPILYLLFMVPPPLGILDSITLPMRYGASVITEIILKSFHFPITREGLLLTLGGHEIFMGAPCSGFRSLITMFSLGLAYVYVSKSLLQKKVILVVSIVPLALFGNLVRILILCLVTYYFGDAVGQGFFHYFSGIVIFIITILGLIGVEIFLDKFMPEKQNE